MTADSDGFITIYSVDSDGAYFVRMEFEVNRLNNMMMDDENVGRYLYIHTHTHIHTLYILSTVKGIIVRKPV